MSIGSHPWHSMSIDAVEETLLGNCVDGLAPEEAERRLKQDGPNALPVAKGRSLLLLFVCYRSPQTNTGLRSVKAGYAINGFPQLAIFATKTKFPQHSIREFGT